MSKTTLSRATIVTLALALALALALTGCIQNMSGLKGALGATDDALDQTSAALDETAAALNSTAAALDAMNSTPKTPPVARISAFAANGALIFKSSFKADDPAEIVFVDAKSKINLIASDSEALERGATVTGFAWTLNGKPLEGARQASAEVGEAGLYTIGLTVTDSNGKSDGHVLKLGVAPEPYDVVTELSTEAVAGGEGQGAPAEVAWELAAPEKPATVTSVVIHAEPPVTCDAVLELVDAEGTVVGSADTSGHQDIDQTEEITLPTLAIGAYTIRVSPFLCVADAVPITVTVTFLPTIEGLGDGHGGHAH